jgi:hypothetical protein
MWEGRDLEHSWNSWWNNKDYKHLKALPLLVIWGIWLAWNLFILKGVPLPPEVSATNNISLFPSFFSQKTSPPSRHTQELILERTSPWGVFDGSSLLSLQETLCGCRPEVLGNLRNECFLYFVNVDQWDNSI